MTRRGRDNSLTEGRRRDKIVTTEQEEVEEERERMCVNLRMHRKK